MSKKAEKLTRAFTLYQESHEFKVGDLVTWKEGLKNRKWPLQDDPAIVVELLEEPIICQQNDPGTPYFGERLNVKLGIIADEGEFLVFHFDLNRFEPYSND